VTVTINGTNDAPLLDLDSNDSAATGNDYAVTFTEGGSAVYIGDTDITISDVDNTTLESATITITDKEAGDLLIVGTLPSGITAGAYDPVTGTITLTGTATLADYQDAIGVIQYLNDGSTIGTSRSIEVVVNDGVSDSAPATTDVTIVTIPTVSVTDVSVQEPVSGTTTLTFTISIDETVGSDLTFDYSTADVSALAGLDYVAAATNATITAGSTSTTVVITINSDSDVFEGDETFTLDLTNFNQTVNFEPGAHAITDGVQAIGSIGANNGAPDAVDDTFVTTPDTQLVTGNVLSNDTLVDNAVISAFDATSANSGTVTYNNDGTFTYTPFSGFTGTDTFTYTLTDDDGETSTATVSVDVNATVVAPPVVTSVPDTAYTENGAAINILSGMSITDADSTVLSSVVITVEGYIAAQDVMDYLTAGTSVIATSTVNGSSWELTLSGGADINEYLTVINSLTYLNSSENPSTATRTVTVEAFDETYANIFGSDAGSITVTAVNDAPEVFDNNVYTLESSVDNGLNIAPPTDADNNDNTLVITVTGLPSTIGTVTLADGTAVTNGQVLTLAELTSLEFDAGVPGSGTFTYTVYDGSETTVATTTINVGNTGSDVNTVYESGLSGGTGGGTAEVTGNILTNDAAAGDTIDKVNFGGTDYSPTGGVIAIDTPQGLLTVYADNNTPGFSVGDYVYTLDTTDNSGNNISEAFTYTFTNGTIYSDTLTISIVDDAPIANDLVQEIPESEEKIFNIVFTLDVSGSMGFASAAVNGVLPIDLAKDALKALALEYFNQSTQVNISLISFESVSNFEGTVDNYADFVAMIDPLTDGGGTDYLEALDMVESTFDADLLIQNSADNVENISYFISDGVSSTDPSSNNFIDFVNSNSIDSYSVGIGGGIPATPDQLNYIHNIDSIGVGGGHVDDALIVTDISQLESELLSTVPTAFGGNITANGSIDNVLFGADGGHVQSITLDIGGTSYDITYDGTNITIPPAIAGDVTDIGSSIEIIKSTNFTYGTFTFDFSDGSYTFSAPNGTAPTTFNFDYTIVDNDGDTDSATATLNIVDDSPEARDDLHTVNPYEIAEGNVISAIGTDGGPSFGGDYTPFATQGGGVDKIVDDADITEFTYKGTVISLDLTPTYTTVTYPDPTGVSASVATNSSTNFSTTDFVLSSDAGVSFNNQGAGVTGGSDSATIDKNDADVALTVTFTTTELPYGVDNLILTMNDFQSNNNDAVLIKLYDADGVLIDSTSYSAQTNPGAETIDLSAFSGIASIDISYSGGWDAQLSNISYEPTPSPGTVDVTTYDLSGSTDGDLSWVYTHEVDRDGNDIFKAIVTDASDSSSFTLGSNGYYNYTPDQTGASNVTPESVNTISLANIDASDLTITAFNADGSVGTLTYNDPWGTTDDGIGVLGGGIDYRIDLGEMVTIDFMAKGNNPNGVNNVTFDLTSYGGTHENVTLVIYGLDGTTILDTIDVSAQTITLSANDYLTIGKVDFIADTINGDTYVRIRNITYDQIDAPAPTNISPVLVEYVLTDTDGQSDTAQLAIYTPDQRITGTVGIDNISGGLLNDQIIGDAGNDILSGNGGHDTISGGLGNDTIDGGTGQDYLSGGDGDDYISGGADNDHVDGDAGNDIVDGGTGDDIVQGGDGNDLLFGGAGNDLLEGEAGNDILDGNAGADTLLGGEGADTLVFDSADTLIDGGNDIDMLIVKETGTLDFSNVHNIEQIDLTGNGVQEIDGLSLNDILSMTDDNNTIAITGDAVDSVGTVDTTGWNKGAETVNAVDSTHTYEYSNGSGDSISVTIDDNVNNTGL
ncbi:MAG: Ig-like domain-containing protein, partial [Helicobacteraceae bacterium]|nr:Ig-like domain-containing protein [Helicobacteraceae bacterium]